MISKLGDDALTEILIRLPDPRSACRSKAVCKLWRSLISEPCFSRRFFSHHQSKSSKPPPSKLLLSADSLRFFIRGPCLGHQNFAVFDCFKDLLLCGFGESANIHTNKEIARSYLLCNPFTEQWVALPVAPERPVGLGGLSARLFCEPLISNTLDLGGGHVYRFRVVCVYQDRNYMKLDVFCSESGKWTKEALVLQDYLIIRMKDVVSCNGVLYVPYVRAQDKDAGLYKPLIAGFDPFCLDMPPNSILVSHIGSSEWSWNISVSQGALHLTVYDDHYKPAGSMTLLIVWRLKEDGESWIKVCEGPLKLAGENFILSVLGAPTLHPMKPEIAFFSNYGIGTGTQTCHVSCDLSKGGALQFVAEISQYFIGWRVFKPEVYCWPTPIPRYQKLRVMYDGGYKSWGRSNELITHPVADKRGQPIDGSVIERSRRWCFDAIPMIIERCRRWCFDAINIMIIGRCRRWCRRIQDRCRERQREIHITLYSFFIIYLVVIWYLILSDLVFILARLYKSFDEF